MGASHSPEACKVASLESGSTRCGAITVTSGPFLCRVGQTRHSVLIQSCLCLESFSKEPTNRAAALVVQFLRASLGPPHHTNLTDCVSYGSNTCCKSAGDRVAFLLLRAGKPIIAEFASDAMW